MALEMTWMELKSDQVKPRAIRVVGFHLYPFPVSGILGEIPRQLQVYRWEGRRAMSS